MEWKGGKGGWEAVWERGGGDGESGQRGGGDWEGGGWGTASSWHVCRQRLLSPIDQCLCFGALAGRMMESSTTRQSSADTPGRLHVQRLGVFAQKEEAPAAGSHPLPATNRWGSPPRCRRQMKEVEAAASASATTPEALPTPRPRQRGHHDKVGDLCQVMVAATDQTTQPVGIGEGEPS